MRQLILTIVVILVGGQSISSNNVAGEWRGWAVFEGEIGEQAKYSPTWKLSLKADGSFIWHFETHTMMTIIEDGTGKYQNQGPRIILKGTAKSMMDDGYRKETSNKPLDQTLSFRDGQLWMVLGPEMTVIFARGGSRPKIPKSLKPQIHLKKSDPKAVKFARAVEGNYASLKSYSDEGTVQSNGQGFQPKGVRFHTRFQEAGKFLFEAEQIEGGKAFGRNVVWSDGRKSWLYMSDPGGQEQRPLGNALSTISVSSGQEAELVTALLIRDRANPHPLSSMKQILLRTDATVMGRKCRVIELADSAGYEEVLWIDKKDMLILKAHFSFASEDVVYHPRANPHLQDRDFVPNVTKPPTLP